MTGKKLSRNLLSLEEQITEQMYVWAASIGIGSEVLQEALFEDITEDIMTPEQHEIYTDFAYTTANLIQDTESNVRVAMNCATTNRFFVNEKRLFRNGVR